MKSIVLILLAAFTFPLTAQTLEDISVDEAIALIADNAENSAFAILDVRTPEEYDPAHIEGAFNFDYYADDFEQQMDDLDKDRQYLIYCASGGRSGQTLQLMESLGFQTVWNMLGGMNAWNAGGHPTTDAVPPFVDLTQPVVNTSLSELTQSPDIQLFPNPTTELIYFENLDNRIVRAVVLTASGSRRSATDLPFSANRLSVANLPGGTYQIAFYDANKRLIATRTFVKM